MVSVRLHQSLQRPQRRASMTLVFYGLLRRLFCTNAHCSSFPLTVCRPIIIKMRVDKGDTLESLSRACGLPVDTLVAANGGAPCGRVCQQA